MRLFTFPSAQGFAALSARSSRPRLGNLLCLRRVNYKVLLPRWIINEINGVSKSIRLLVISSARGFVLSSAGDYIPRPENPL